METATEEAQEVRSVLDLYGGKEAVLKRMGSLIKSKLEKKLVRDELEFSVYSMIPFETLTQIAKGDYSLVNKKIYEKLEGYLNLDIWDILSKPDLSNSKIRAYWKNQMIKNPMSAPYHNNENKNITLYVNIVASGEFMRALIPTNNSKTHKNL